MKISVILTSFNHEKYIREAIDSILNQTFADFELIIWDDASTDGSWSIIQSYKDSRIRAFRNDEQRRAVYGINKAIFEVARGEYIAIHHSDDIWMAEKLEKQFAFLDQNPDIGAVFCNALAVGEDGSPLEKKDHFYSDIFSQPNRTRYEWLNFFFYNGNALCHPSVLVRKDCYARCRGYRYGLAQLGDFDMWIRLCLSYEIHVFGEKLVHFRVRDNEGNASGNTQRSRIRNRSEWFFLVQNYLHVSSCRELLKIFPEHRGLAEKAESPSPGYLLAKIAIAEKTRPWMRLFGLNLLFHIVNSEHSHLFDYRDLPRLAAGADIFSLEKIDELQCIIADRDAQLAALDSRLAARDAQLAALDSRLAGILNSHSWRVTLPLRKACHYARTYLRSGTCALRTRFYRIPFTPEQKKLLRKGRQSFWAATSYACGIFRATTRTDSSRPSDLVRRAMASSPVRILLIERSVPRPDQDAGSVMIYNFIKVLRAMGCALTFLPMDRAYDAVYTPALEALGVSCLHAPDVVSFQHYLKREGGSFNLILSCRPDQTQELLPLFQRFAPQARILYETHDLHFIREQRQAELEGKQHLREQAVWRKNQELGIMAAVDCTLVVSEDERRILQTESPGLSVEVIPVVSEIFGSKVGFDERRDLVFIGGFEHRPNVDAVKFFVQEILPLILSHIPDIRFHVIGSHPPSEITELASANIVVHGFVPDLSEIMNHVRISVNPVRFGAGVKGKLVTSLSYGVPCIGTHIAVEGMQLEPGLHALVADTPQDFAEAVAQLYRDKTLWRKLSAEGLKFVQRRFSLDVAANSFAHIFKDMFPFEQRSFVLERIVSSDELRAYLQKKPGQSRRELGSVSDERFDPVETHAFCWVCNRKVTFRFESSQGESDVIGNPSSSWIKGMVCPSCRFDGPARAGIHFFHLLCAPSSQSRICLIGPTPLLFAWFQEKYSQVVRCECPGRAALSDEADAMKGSRDLLPLGSLPENMFDAIVFFDNLPEDWGGGNLSRVFTRCLKPGGNLFLSISREQAAYRTAESAYSIDSHDPNNYTGQDGFYMGLFEQFQGIGLSGVAAYCYWSQRYGYMESDQILFKITK